MSDWTDDVKRQQATDAEAEGLKREAEVYKIRKLQSLAVDWWSALGDRVRSDAAKLGMSVKESPALLIEHNAGNQVACLSLQPKLEADHIRVVFSHSVDHFSHKTDRVLQIFLKLEEGARIAAHLDGQVFFTAESLSEYLLRPLLNYAPPRPSSPWA